MQYDVPGLYIATAIRCLLLVVMLLATSAVSVADNILGPLRAQIAMPEVGMPLDGFTVLLDVGEENSAGYVPVKIRMTAAGRFPADRRFNFRFTSIPSLEAPPQNGLVVNVPIMVEQNATSQTFIRYLPKWSTGQAVSVVVSEEGRQLDGYEGFFGGERVRAAIRGSRLARIMLQNEYKLNWVFISEQDRVTPDSLPKIQEIFKAEGSGIATEVLYADSQSNSSFLNGNLGAADFQAVGQTELPEDWRAYQRFDVILINPLGLQRLKTKSQAMQAVRDWVLNGGTVVVFNAPTARQVVDEFGFAWAPDPKNVEILQSVAYELTTNWQRELGPFMMTIQGYESHVQAVQRRIAEVTAAAEKAAADGESADTENAGAAEVAESESTAEPEAEFFMESIGTSYYGPLPYDPVETRIRAQQVDASNDLVFLEETLQNARQVLQANQREVEQRNRAVAMTAIQWGDEIQVQGAGAGCVVAIKAQQERDSPTPTHWKVLGSYLSHRASATLRRGVDPLMGDQRFIRWTIPGVAQPPVYTFMGLLTLFVILVGPIAYRQTSKVGRSYWMFAIAPLLALVTTAAMFGYGIVADGFGTRVRIRQLTWVDGKSGNAGERVRSTYFAGVRPSGGLRFASDAELMPYQESMGLSWDDLVTMQPGTRGELTLEDDSQHLNSSFLPSRQQRQFVVHAPRHKVGGLQLTPDPQGIDSPSVTSGFSFAIRQGVLRDASDNYWKIENLEPGQVKRTEPLTSRDASKLMGQLYNDYRPLAEVRETRSSTNRYDNQIYDVILDTNRILQTGVAFTDGLFEHWLQQHLQTNGEIPRDHFVAITDVSEDVVAVENVEVTSSIRYVFGTLQ